ncbi:Alpha-1,3-mannosyl-glycoprotein 2-beta-N-acetylglucosaminyltransferase [Armadillidium nasatum]|uniref:Alpha-1,3-mannosyl-glycoprotein 2-beta-N-acetylglucosaminyltransferase n=1 Tax=Armadillidium nasatum TaxID=96803 RepID=A0A5N5TE97_9CRUS|nr:Alpha-1,3-mannosyl-glycoprotein 2-beta-N-acetylglucosaminyltransferase [Armadillidium nasatum]
MIQARKHGDIGSQISVLESEIKDQSLFYNSILDKLRTLKKHQEDVLQKKKSYHNEDEKSNKGSLLLTEGPVIPILMIACNREPAIRRSLDLLIKHRPSKERFPIIVSQDCGHQPTKQAILSFGDQINLIEQPDLRMIEVPLKEKKFRGYFLIARHYKWALDQIFNKFNYDVAIIVEDDLDIAPDFFEYFAATYPLLKSDPTLYCISAWNDNGNGLFYEKFLKYIHLNSKYTEFTKMDLSYLRKENYDDRFDREIQRSQVVSLTDVKSGRLVETSSYRLIYHTKDNFKKITKALGIMDDFKAGVPRTGYHGVVSFFYNGRRIYLSPNVNWKGYDPSWS